MVRNTKAAPPAALPYFRPAALTFLRNLAKHNDREWFTPRKPQFEAELKEPMLAIVRKVTDAMMDFAPEHVRPAEKSLFRIYRDTRFSKDKTPYKDHIGAYGESQGGAGFYVQFSATGMIAGSGYYQMATDQLDRYRTALAGRHRKLHRSAPEAMAPHVSASGKSILS